MPTLTCASMIAGPEMYMAACGRQPCLPTAPAGSLCSQLSGHCNFRSTSVCWTVPWYCLHLHCNSVITCNLINLIRLGICMSHAVTACVQVVLRIVLHGRDIRERIGALKVLQAFCVANSEGQQALITTVTLPSTKPQQTTGELAAAL